MAPQIFSIVSSLLVIVGMRSLLQMACDSSAVEEPMLNKIFQRGHQTDFPPRTARLVFQSVVGAIASTGPMLGLICVIESHSLLMGSSE